MNISHFFFFEVLIFQVSKKFKIEIFKFIQFHFQNKNENLNAFTNSIFVVRWPWYSAVSGAGSVGGWVDVQFLAGDDCGDKGQHNVESFLRDVLMQMLC